MAVQIAPRSSVRKHRIALDEYERMIDADVFREDLRLELIRGEIIEMSPPGFEHELVVARLAKLLERKAGDVAIVWPQGNSIRLAGSDSRPQPDMTLLRWRDDYSVSKPPASDDVLLVVEVSDSSLRYDRSEKMALYAEAGIAEYWIVNIQNKVVEIYSDPVGGTYASTRKLAPGDLLPLPGGFQGEIAVSEILRSSGSTGKQG